MAKHGVNMNMGYTWVNMKLCLLRSYSSPCRLNSCSQFLDVCCPHPSEYPLVALCPANSSRAPSSVLMAWTPPCQINAIHHSKDMFVFLSSNLYCDCKLVPHPNCFSGYCVSFATSLALRTFSWPSLRGHGCCLKSITPNPAELG